MVRVDGEIYGGVGCSRKPECLREGVEGKPSADRSEHDLCLCDVAAWSSFPEWRAQSDGGYPHPGGTGQTDGDPDRRQGFQDGSNTDEDDSGTRVAGACSWRERLVLNQYPG